MRHGFEEVGVVDVLLAVAAVVVLEEEVGDFGVHIGGEQDGFHNNL